MRDRALCIGQEEEMWSIIEGEHRPGSSALGLYKRSIVPSSVQQVCVRQAPLNSARNSTLHLDLLAYRKS
jgi:hypothetical protein